MTDNDIDFILNELRKASIRWEGRRKCLERHRVSKLEGTFKNGKPKYKFYWKCAKCGNEFRDQDSLEVDHIDEVGPYKGDIHKFCERLFCEQDNLQALCTVCHKVKTSKFNATLRWQRKK